MGEAKDLLCSFIPSELEPSLRGEGEPRNFAFAGPDRQRNHSHQSVTTPSERHHRHVLPDEITCRQMHLRKANLNSFKILPLTAFKPKTWLAMAP